MDRLKLDYIDWMMNSNDDPLNHFRARSELNEAPNSLTL